MNLQDVEKMLAKPNTWDCENECGRDAVVWLVAEANRLQEENERLDRIVCKLTKNIEVGE